MGMKKWIFVKTEFEGLHRWKDAPDEVFYLRFPHRHIFKVKVMIEVKHNDREIEFILFKHYVEEKLYEVIDMNECGSCEMIGEKLINVIKKDFPDRKIKVEVSEDGENGAIIEYEGEDE